MCWYLLKAFNVDVIASANPATLKCLCLWPGSNYSYGHSIRCIRIHLGSCCGARRGGPRHTLMARNRRERARAFCRLSKSLCSGAPPPLAAAVGVWVRGWAWVALLTESCPEPARAPIGHRAPDKSRTQVT